MMAAASELPPPMPAATGVFADENCDRRPDSQRGADCLRGFAAKVVSSGRERGVGIDCDLPPFIVAERNFQLVGGIVQREEQRFNLVIAVRQFPADAQIEIDF